MTPNEAFPHLTPNNHRITSPASDAYNCIAWSAEDMEHWWQPNVFWPIEAPPNDYGVGVLEKLFNALGYEDCGMDLGLESGVEKVALFGNSVYYTHAARQLTNGKMTSKLGKGANIEHYTPENVARGVYGDLVQVMKRTISPRS